MREEKALFLGEVSDPNSQIVRLPRAIPLAHLFQHVSDTVFGYDEFGSRVVMAILGTACVGIVFLMLDGLKGRPTALATALLVALAPNHVFLSQETRFYMTAAFFTYLTLLVGAYAAQRRTTPLCILLSFLILVAMLCHTVMAILLPIAFVGILVGAYAERQPLPKNVVVVFLVSGFIMAVFYLLYLKPLISGWNEAFSTGSRWVTALRASVARAGWSVVLLAALGFLLLLHRRNAQNWYWVICAIGWVGVHFMLPLVIVFRPVYVVPLAIIPMVLAVCAIGTVYEELRKRGALIGAVWILAACLGELPSLASHYMDGSRTDVRDAVFYIQQHWQPGDRLAVSITGTATARHYIGNDTAVAKLASEPLEIARRLNELASQKQRLWVILESDRSGLPEEVVYWVGNRCTHKLQIRKARYDFQNFTTDVFLFTPANAK
jgi:4-amino-4-deoxy-L-arabinose transferase-like glycosyltransferase